MKWVSVWTSVTFRVQDSQFSIHNSVFIKIRNQLSSSSCIRSQLDFMFHLLCFDDVITASRITLFKVTSNYNFYGMISSRPTKLK